MALTDNTIKLEFLLEQANALSEAGGSNTYWIPVADLSTTYAEAPGITTTTAYLEVPDKIKVIVGIPLVPTNTYNLAVAERTSTGLVITKAGSETTIYFGVVPDEPNILAITYSTPEGRFVLLTDKEIPLG